MKEHNYNKLKRFNNINYNSASLICNTLYEVVINFFFNNYLYKIKLTLTFICLA